MKPTLKPISEQVVVITGASSAAVAEFGRIDTWVNNAAVSLYGRLMEMPAEIVGSAPVPRGRLLLQECGPVLIVRVR